MVLWLRTLVQSQSNFLRWLWYQVGSRRMDTKPEAAHSGLSEETPALATQKGQGEGQATRGHEPAAPSQLPVPPSMPPVLNKPNRPRKPSLAAVPEASVPTASSGQVVEGQLATLVQAMSMHKDALPEPIRALLAAQEEATAASRAKVMHRAVASQTNCQKQLASLRASRTQYLQGWQKYLGDLLTNLEKQLEEKKTVMADFATTEATLEETIEAARDQVLQMAGGEVKAESDGMETEPTSLTEVAAPVAPSATVPDLRAKEDGLREALHMAKEALDQELTEVNRERTPTRKSIEISDDEQGL